MTITMKKAWEMARELFLQAEPIIRSAEEQTWEENLDVSAFYDHIHALDWGSNVPGSGAPEKNMVAAVQALENRGYRVSERGYRYLQDGLKAFKQKDYTLLHQYSALLKRELEEAEIDQDSDYWNYRYYHRFAYYLEVVTFPKSVPVCPDTFEFRDQIRAGWLGQLIGGAMGTMVEGYSSRSILEERICGHFRGHCAFLGGDDPLWMVCGGDRDPESEKRDISTGERTVS